MGIAVAKPKVWWHHLEMSYFKVLLGTLLICLSITCFSETNNFLFREGNLAIIAPPGVNKDYYLLEFGFVIQKKIKALDYNYNAYVNAALFEDWKGRLDNLHAGALGFKGGVLFPVPSVPLFMKVGVGFAKTVLHKNPVWGKSEQNVDKKDMFLLELGAFYSFDRYFLSFTYQKTNVHYFRRNSFLAIGVNY